MNDLFTDNIDLVALVLRRITFFPPIEYEDLHQEGLLILWKCAEVYDPTQGLGQFVPYTKQMLRRRLIDYIRKVTKYNHNTQVRYPKTVQLTEDFDRKGVEGANTDWILYESLIIAIRKLDSPIQRKVMFLKMRGVSLTVISKIVGRTPGRIHQIIRINLPRLKELMCDY